MIRKAKSILIIAAAILIVGGALGQAEAQGFGRVKLVVMLSTGEPAEGVKITATCTERGNFHEELTTNKKGEAIFSVVDATKIYQLHFEHPGYSPLDLDVKAPLRAMTVQEVVLGQAAPPPPPPSSGQLTPAQEVFNEGVKAAQDDDYKTAKEKFLAALELDPDLAFAHLALAGLYFDEADYPTALRYADRLLELDPSNTRGYRIRYEANLKLGNQEEAQAALEVLSRLDQSGDTAAVVFNEGVAAFRVGDLKTAKANFLHALEIKSDLTAAMSALAVVYLQEGSYAEAAAMAERCLALEPDNAKALRHRWEAYRHLGDQAKEQEALAALAAKDPTALAEDLYRQGSDLFEQGDTAAAQARFEEVLEIDPQNARAHYQLGLCLVSSGNKVKAREHLEKFLELAPGDAEAESAREMLSYLK